MLNHINMPDPQSKYGTKLDADQEKRYQQWKSSLPKTLQYEGNYDLRGLWQENPRVKPSANLHFPDKYKLPNHPTFSDESKYFNDKTKNQAGHWQETDSSWNYVPYNPSVKKPIIEKKEVTKSASNPDAEVKDWMLSYVNSPKYKERLAGFYKYPEYIQNQRQGVLSGTKIKEVPSGSTQYYSYDNELSVSPSQLAALKAGREEAVTHELGHAINANNQNKAAALSIPESRYIMERNKALIPDIRESVLRSAKDTNRNVSKIMGGELHDVTPSENLSDVQALRFLLKKRGIYDAGTQDFNPDVLKKASKDPVIRKSFIFKRLKDNFDEQGLQEIMNKVAATNNKTNSNLV